jgi:hypothetical protein
MDDQILPVERLTRPLDRFRCEPFRAMLTVRACLARQTATWAGGRMKGHGPKVHAEHPECVACELGAAVARQVPPVVTATVVCSASGCTTPVTGARGRKPLCGKHRANAALVGVSR